jgi:transcriptional regulator with XRE-family HTH domain
MAKKPHQDSRLAKFLDTRLLELKHLKTQAQIAEEAGFRNPNMLTMIKQGSTKLPLDRVPDLATALDTDRALLLRLALEQAEGNTAAAAIYDIIGEPITENERAWLAEIRDASGDTDPRLTSRAKAAIRSVLTK